MFYSATSFNQNLKRWLCWINRPSTVSSKWCFQASCVSSSQPSTLPSTSFQPSTQPSTSFQPSTPCERGYFKNSTSCYPYPIGTFYDGRTFGTEYAKCPAGSFQNEMGAHECNSCAQCSFQMKKGQSECIKYRPGGYCSDASPASCDGGFTPCPVGTFNEHLGSTNITACRSCPKDEKNRNLKQKMHGIIFAE